MMNEEEVILALKELKDWEGLPYCIEEPMQNEGIAVITKEALDKAIKALEQQTCENCISKEEVDTLVDELARAISDERCCISRGRSTATIMQDILNLPSVTPTRPKGKWKPLNYKDEMWGYVYKCSNCGAIEYGGDYCPGCGADMRESEENADE